MYSSNIRGLHAGYVEASRELGSDCPWASQNPAALVLSIPNPQGKQKEEKLSPSGEGGGKSSEKCSASSGCFNKRTQGKTTEIDSFNFGIFQFLSI